MVNIAVNLASLLALLLILFGLLLIPLGLWLRRPFRAANLVQDIVLALVYLLSGLILLISGWRLDPILQLSQLLLIAAIIYLTTKDIFYRSSNSRS